MPTTFKLFGGLIAMVLLAGCASDFPLLPSSITQTSFGSVKGAPVDIFTLRNAHGLEARICNYGGIMVSLKVPDRDGNLADIVFGYDKLDDYVKNNPYFGALIGRYGNRIARGKFTLDGKSYSIATNNYPNTLHGGIAGFDKVVWQARIVDKSDPTLELTYVSKDGEEGYPGTLTVKAVYTLTRNNELRLQFTATTDKPTIVNLTDHSYFNLAGKGDILGHQLFIDADAFTPVDSTLIPTGELAPVRGTPFDFRQPTAIGARINQPDQQLKYGLGYDHNWVINKTPGRLTLMARLSDPASGRTLEILSTEPGLQFYSGNFLDGAITGKSGWAYPFRSGLCLEPQHFPDSPNHPAFPTTVLRPGQTYHNTIIYRFSAK